MKRENFNLQALRRLKYFMAMINKFLMTAGVVFMSLVGVCASAADCLAEDNVQTFVEFKGEIVDQDALAVSAVLPLEFRIYETEKAKKAISTEKHFVSVVDGKYTVTLGDQTAISNAEPELYVAVLMDGKELTRQKVSTARHIVNTKVESKVKQTKTVSSSEDGNFSLKCPNGYVVTGIEGSRSDGKFESIRLICSNVF